MPVFYRDNPVSTLQQMCTAQNAKFLDHHFPPMYSSLEWSAHQNKFFDRIAKMEDEMPPNLEWRRLIELAAEAGSPAIFKQGTDICDVVQGALRDCWLLSTIARFLLSRVAVVTLFVNECNRVPLQRFLMSSALCLRSAPLPTATVSTACVCLLWESGCTWYAICYKVNADWKVGFGRLRSSYRRPGRVRTQLRSHGGTVRAKASFSVAY